MARASAAGARQRTARMTGSQRREQLITIGRRLFASKGFEGTSVEEVAARATVSKPVVYEHFGGKEGLYAVIVDREIQTLLTALQEALEPARAHPRLLMESATMALLTYIEEHEDGFRILVRDSPVAQAGGTFSSLLGDVAAQVEGLLRTQLEASDLDITYAPIYAQMLVGMVALTGQYWLEERKPSKEQVAAVVVNLSWNGLRGLEPHPALQGDRHRHEAHPRGAADDGPDAG